MAGSTSITKLLGDHAQLKYYLKILHRTRGWAFWAAWAQRATGVLLLLYVWLHIITLSGLSQPDKFNSQMKIFGFILFVVLEWLLAIPVIYHALNGGRLILYEIFQIRKEEILLKWVLFLGGVYTILLAFFMIIGDQQVSAAFFWVYMAAASACIVYITIKKLKASGASLFWKLQRISGIYLLLMIPAHMLFMHLNPEIGHEAQTIIERMGNPFIKIVDFSLLAGVLYHGAYGVYSISQDYIASEKIKIGVVVLLSCVTLLFAWTGLRLIIMI
ncbi:MAG: succinate dehydrogenase, hydrophobic membrane anchor protein [Desulfobacteraceae bacterium]|nr:succinate dehydrogenase, hydrophobic membrane anchor protein [Desulfobacteraceae bacterium]